MEVPTDFDPREPYILICDEGVTVFGPTRTEIAVRILEKMIETHTGPIAELAVTLTDQLIEELKKEKSNG